MNVFPPKSPQSEILLMLILLTIVIFNNFRLTSHLRKSAADVQEPIDENRLKRYKGFENSNSNELTESIELIKQLANTIINSKII